MSNRLNLHNTLTGIIKNVYYKPPETVKMSYPCIRYEMSSIESTYANDARYKNIEHYTLTLIDKSADSQYVEKIMEIPYSTFDRAYVSDGLYHYVFSIDI